MKLISNSVIENADRYAAEFAAATPFKHVIIDNFFTPEAHAALVEEFPSHGSTDGIVGDYGSTNAIKGGKSNVLDFGPHYVEWDQTLQSSDFLGLLGQISGIDDLLYDPDYNGAGIHENFEGKRNRIHIDYNYHPRTKWHRRLNAIIYITPDWDPDHGGGLKLYEDGFAPREGERKLVSCTGNRCVLFETTENSWHGVQTIALPEGMEQMTRKSITAYFYTEDRPAELTASRHATIYTPGEMPAAIQSGHTLSDKDVTAILGYENNVNSLARSLYGEHSRLYEKINTLETRNSEYKERTDAKLQELRDRNMEMKAKLDELRARRAKQQGETAG